MSKKAFMSGNEAVATALRQINPDVFPAFPITPSTEVPQYFSNYVANGLVDTEFITVESEHSSMSAAMGASAAGARALTATSSAGLAFMWEVLGVAASSRLPVGLAAVCRALTGPLNINCDHSDTMGARDSGWIQLYAEDNQEAYDTADTWHLRHPTDGRCGHRRCWQRGGHQGRSGRTSRGLGRVAMVKQWGATLHLQPLQSKPLLISSVALPAPLLTPF